MCSFKEMGKLAPNLRHGSSDRLIGIERRRVYCERVWGRAQWRPSTRRVPKVALLHVVFDLVQVRGLACRHEFAVPADRADRWVGCDKKLDRGPRVYDRANVPPIEHRAAEASGRGLAKGTLEVQQRAAHRAVRGDYRGTLPHQLAPEVFIGQILWRDCHSFCCRTWHNAVLVWHNKAVCSDGALPAQDAKSSRAVQRPGVEVREPQLLRNSPAESSLAAKSCGLIF